MAWAHVQSGGTFAASSGTTVALAYGSNVTAGDRLVARCIWAAGIGHTLTGALTDTQGNTWTARKTPVTFTAFGEGIRIQCFDAPAGSSAACTVTLTTSGTTTQRHITVFEFSGLDAAAPFDDGVIANGTSAAPTANLPATATANELVVGGWYNGDVFTKGAAYTLGPVVDGNGTQYKNQATAAVTAFDCTQASSALYGLAASALKEPAAAGASPAPSLVMAPRIPSY